MKKSLDSLTTVIGLGLFLLSPATLDAHLWKDASGKHEIEAEFVSLVGDSVELKTPSGRVVKLSLAKLSEADRAIAIKLAAPDSAVAPGPAATPANPAAIAPGAMKVTAKGKLQAWASIVNGKQKNAWKLTIVVTALEGVAADAYAVGPVTMGPLTVGGEILKPEDSLRPAGFDVIDRSKEGFFAKHPKNGINAELNFGEVPLETKSAGPLKGAVKVLAGGTEKAAMIPNLLTRPVGLIDDPALKAAGLVVKFTRQDLGETIQVGVQLERKSAAAFAAIELVGADGGKVDGGYGFVIDHDSGTADHTKSAPKNLLEKATLKFRFREGAKEVEIPFDFPEVEVSK
jgi:hypothetical protein